MSPIITIKGIYSSGYAGATMGGTSFMIDIEEKELRGVRNPVINIVIKTDGSRPSKVYPRMASKLISDNGKVSIWAEDAKFTASEIKAIREWADKNNIIEEGYRIEREHEQSFQELLAVHTEIANGIANDISREELKELRDKLHEANRKMNRLRGILDV